VQIWDLESNGRLSQIWHSDCILTIDISADSRLLATSGCDRRVRVWELSTGVELANLPHPDPVKRIRFLGNGRTLVSGDARGVVREWLLDPDQLQERACAQLKRNLTAQEWDRYLGASEPYAKTCDALPISPSYVEAVLLRAKKGELSFARAELQRLRELDPGLDIDPDRALSEVGQAVYREAEELARAGNMRVAQARFEYAKKLELEFEYDARAAADYYLQDELIERSTEYAERGDFAAALAALERANALQTGYKVGTGQWGSLCLVARDGEPTAEALQICARALDDESYPRHWELLEARGIIRAILGDITGARSDLEAVAAASERSGWVARPAGWNALCWHGAIRGKAAEVLQACDRAVEETRGDNYFRDSRGIARALTGNFAGAVEDFRAFVADESIKIEFPQLVQLRMAWISELERGQDPFRDVDLATLE
jgi:tetratricopeptide (TPR) repeat protein